jgi:hypothetical protein
MAKFWKERKPQYGVGLQVQKGPKQEQVLCGGIGKHLPLCLVIISMVSLLKFGTSNTLDERTALFYARAKNKKGHTEGGKKTLILEVVANDL